MKSNLSTYRENFNDYLVGENKRNLASLKMLICCSIIFSVLFNFLYYPTLANNNNEVNENSFTNSQTDDYVNNGIIDYCGKVGGITSQIVSNSTNPLVWLATLSWIGVVQKSDSNIPLVNSVQVDFSSMPFSDKSMAVSLTIIAVFLVIARSLKGAKIITFATVDKIERLFGQITSVLLVLLSTSSMTALAATTSSVSVENIVMHNSVLNTVLSIIFSVTAGILYYVIKTICSALEIMAFLFSPLPGVSGLVENIKTVFTVSVSVVAISNPILSFIICIFVIVLSLYFFKRAYIFVNYFQYMYIRPFWNGVFHKRKVFPLVGEVPKKISKQFEGIEIAIPVFPSKAIEQIRKRSMCWFIISEDSKYICKNYIFKTPLIIPIESLITEDDEIYLQKTFRNLRIFTNENSIDRNKKLLLVFSREYGNQFGEIVDKTSFIDFNELEEKRKEEEREKKQLEAIERKQQKLQNKAIKQLEKNKAKENWMQKKHNLKVEQIKAKQLIKAKQKELKDNLKQLKETNK